MLVGVAVTSGAAVGAAVGSAVGVGVAVLSGVGVGSCVGSAVGSGVGSGVASISAGGSSEISFCPVSTSNETSKLGLYAGTLASSARALNGSDIAKINAASAPAKIRFAFFIFCHSFR